MLESFHVFISKDLSAYALCYMCGMRYYLEFAMVKQDIFGNFMRGWREGKEVGIESSEKIHAWI